MPRTSLPWFAYQKLANKYFSKGVKPAAIKELLGEPIWEGESWHIKASGNGTIARERLEGRQKRKAASDALRITQSQSQTVGRPDFGPNTKGKALEAHHLRMLSLYAPLFAGASEADQVALAKHAASVGMPLGDTKANRGDLPIKQHSKLHNYMRKQGLTGAHMPDFSKADLANRIKAFDSFYKDIIQPDIDSKTMSIMQDYRKNNPAEYKANYSSKAKPQPKTKTTPKPTRSTAGAIEANTRSSLSINGVPVAQVGTLQGGGYRIDLDPFSGASMMIP